MKKTFLLILFSFTAIFAFNGNGYSNDNLAQLNSPASPDNSKWYFGGNIGVNFWNDYFLISAEPMAGYKVTSKFSLGAKLNYSFRKDNNSAPQNFTYNNYGGSIFARYNPVPRGYLHAEFNFINYKPDCLGGLPFT